MAMEMTDRDGDEDIGLEKEKEKGTETSRDLVLNIEKRSSTQAHLTLKVDLQNHIHHPAPKIRYPVLYTP